MKFLFLSLAKSDIPRAPKVIEKASEGRLAREYTYGPVVRLPASGGTAAVTIKELQRPASAATGPALELKNVTAWCGSNWQAAAPTAAAALSESSSKPWTVVPAPASVGRRGEAGSDPSSPLSLNAAARDQQTTAGRMGSTGADGNIKTRGWIRPLAVAGGCCALLSGICQCSCRLCVPCSGALAVVVFSRLLHCPVQIMLLRNVL
jgi:hypothetical protein